MTTNQPLLSGGQLVVAALRAHGVEFAFSVAGESYLEVLDALFDAPEIRLVTCRQEGGAAFMAEAYGKLTGKPGVLLVTRGPGACNASIGIHTAFQDSTPMVVLVGQVARHQLDREALQEVDFRKMFAPLAKWVTQIDLAERVPELVNQAFQVATSGRPGSGGPGAARGHAARSPHRPGGRPLPPGARPPGAADLAELRRLLAAAERPMMLVGGSGWSDAACRDITSFARANDLPVCCSFRRQDIVDNRMPCFVGDLGTGASPALVARVKEADLLLAVGARIGEITSQSYSLLGIPDPGKVLIHVHAAAEELGRVFRPTLAIQSGMPEFAAAAAALAPVAAGRWSRWREAARAEYEAGLVPSPSGGPLDLGRDHGMAARAPARRRDRNQRRRQFQRLAEPLSAVSPTGTPARADQRRHGLRRARRGCRQARPSRSSGRRLRRPPVQGHEITAKVAADGKVTVTNGRNGFSKKLHGTRKLKGRASSARFIGSASAGVT